MSADAAGTDPGQPVATSQRSDKIGLLIIRAWVEKGSPEPLRACVRSTTDIAAGIDHTLTLTHAEEVGATVQKWLVEVLGERELVQPSG